MTNEKTKVQKKEGLEYKPWSGLAWQRLTVFCLILLVAISLGIVSEDSSAPVGYLIMLILAGGIFLLGLWLLKWLLIWPLTQRWFWIITLGLSALASAFACIASIIHFQILGAVGFFVLAFVLFEITSDMDDL